MILAAILTLLIWFPVSSSFNRNVYSVQAAWKVDLFLVSCVWSSISTVDASPPPEEVAKLKEKITKGKVLLEDLNELLKDIKTEMNEEKGVEKEKLKKVTEIIDSFRQLEVDPGDLQKELLEKFKERTLEAFKLLLENFNYGEVPLIKILEETKDFDETSNTLAKRFAEEL